MSTGSTRHSQSGITLIESLVALVVTAVALFGLLGIQMRTLVDTQAGARRAQAIRLIEDLGERMQNNPNALGNLAAYTGTPASAAVDCGTAPCTPAELAEYDIWQWRQNVISNLPGGSAQVFVPSGGARQLGVLIGWREGEYNLDGQERTVAETTQLKSVFTVTGTDSAGGEVKCPDGLLCHLQYLQPLQRCTPWSVGGGALYCPN
ncbi:type IV pilus modification protein PilV [Ottowia beijingensis]